MAHELLPQAFYNRTSITIPESAPLITLTSLSHPITLRTLQLEDIRALTQLLSNPANVEDDLSISNQTPYQIKEMIGTWLIRTSPLERLNFIILASGIPIGISGLGWIGPAIRDDENSGRAGAVGVMLNPEARGKGYAYEAMRISIDFGLRELGLIEVRIGTQSRNMAMKGLMEKKFGIPAIVMEPDRFGNDLR
jgi:RimJ/RimL family protein N-acetyltransferase